MNDSVAKKTPLYDIHKASGAKMVDFGGWMMPVSYSSVLTEHRAVRERAGLFDVSHMGEIVVSGKGAAAFLQKLTINDLSRLESGQGQYSAMLRPTGGMIDDIIVYRLASDRFFICVNAANIAKDYDWIYEQAAAYPDAVVSNQSADWGQVAVQGPQSQAALQSLLGADASLIESLDYMQIVPATLYGCPSFIARTGYTGERGYELYLPVEILPRVWTTILERSAHLGVQPIGLGARDTLRLEACYLLYGNDMNEKTSPLEAGIAWATRLDKGEFIGRDALLKQKAKGLEKLLVAFKMEADGIPRHDMSCYRGDQCIGVVTSGSVLPTIGGAGGLALLDPRQIQVGELFEVDVRGKRKLARVVKKPLYNAKIRA